MIKPPPEYIRDPGTHYGHPFWRQSPRGRDYVVIGRDREDPDDEVWTWSRLCVRDLRDCLASDVAWSRGEWERDVCARGKLFERGQSIRCTMVPNGAPTALAERIFDGWVAEGLLRRPTDEEYEAITDLPSSTRQMTRSSARDRWMVDDATRDAWVAVRLLVMADW